MAYIPPLNGGRVNVAIGGNTAGAAALASTGTVTLAGGNNIVLSQAGNAITISGSNQSLQTQNNIQALVGGTATSTASTGTVTFANSNGVTFGMSGNTMTASVAAGGNNFGAGMIAAGNSAGNAGFAASQLAFVGGNNITLSQSTAAGGSNTITVSGPTFNNANGVSFGTNGGTVTASHNGITSQSAQTQNNIQALVGGTATSTASTGTVTFANSNGVTFGMSGNTMTASVAAGGGIASVGMPNTTYSNNFSVSGFGAISISGSTDNIMDFSVPAVSSLVGAGGISIVSGGNNITISNTARVGSLARWEYPTNFTALANINQGNMSIQHVMIPFNVAGTAAKIAGSLLVGTTGSATTGAVSMTLWMGLYTLNGSTLSQITSGSANNSFLVNNTSNTGNNSSITGMRQLTAPLNVNITPGEYWVAAVISSTTNYSANNATFSIYGNNLIAQSASLNAIGNTGGVRDVYLGQGIFPSVTSAGPSSIAVSAIINSSSGFVQRAAFYHAFFNAIY